MNMYDYKEKKTAFSLKTVLIALLISAIIIAIILIFFLPQKSVYKFGDKTVKYNLNDTVKENAIYIGMNALSDYCEFEKTEIEDGFKYSVNNSFVIFYDCNSFYQINGNEKRGLAPSYIKNGDMFVPITTIADCVSGISFEIISDKEIIISKTNDQIKFLSYDVKYLSSDYEKYMPYIKTSFSSVNIIANKENSLSNDYVPQNLVSIPKEYTTKDISLCQPAEMALELMMKDLYLAGYNSHIFVTSAYRSYAYQTSLFNTYIEEETEKGYSYEKAKERVLTYSAYPGTSEHQTGLCVDLMSIYMSELDESFEDYEAFAWLQENAWKYGFILRYPKGKEAITGYTYEPWHYRFVGIDAAYEIYKQGITLEEYV